MMRVLALILLLSAQAVMPALGEEAPAELRVVLKVTPPFVERDADGNFHGASVELWEDIATRLDLQWSYSERDLAGVLDAVAAGEADLGIGALTMTAERETRMDFTHPFLSAGLAIAVPDADSASWLAVAQRFLSLEFLQVLGALSVVLTGFGTALWLVERRSNDQQFGGTVPQGLFEGFWWAAVTMTTVGYGDRYPISPAGRAIALVWMFTSIIIISTFTAAITSALTVGELSSSIRGPQDLNRATVGGVRNAASMDWLALNQIERRDYPDLEAALAALAAGKLDAVVHDEPILRHAVRNGFPALQVLRGSFNRQDYAFVLRSGHPQREAINRALLTELAEPSWQQRRAELSP